MSIYKILFRVLLPLSILVPVIILLQYRLHMSGEISSDPQHWGVFGSILGGVFTLVGGLATTLTLLFLNQQQKLNAEAINRQVSTLTFDQYVKHLEHFKIFMETVGKRNRIKFSDIDRLYHFIFPENRPTSCTFKVDLNKPGKENALDELSKNLKDLILHLENPKQQTPAENAIICLAQLQKTLIIKFDEHFSGNGNVKLTKQKTGLFLDKLETQTKAIESVVDEIMYFSGNERISASRSITDWLTPTRELIKVISYAEADTIALEHSNRGAQGLLKLHKLVHSANIIEELKTEVNNLYSGEKLVQMLQLDYAKSQGQKIASTLRIISNQQETQNDSLIDEAKEIVVEFFDYDYRYFN